MPNFNSKISDLIKFAYEVFIHHEDEYTANYLMFNGTQFSNTLTDSLLKQIEQHIYATTENAYVVIDICFNEYCTGTVKRDLPTSNVLFKAVGEHMDLTFSNPDIYFPEECYPSGSATSTICNRNIKNPSKLPIDSSEHLAFVNCNFSSSLRGLKGTPRSLIFTNCTGILFLS